MSPRLVRIVKSCSHLPGEWRCACTCLAVAPIIIKRIPLRPASLLGSNCVCRNSGPKHRRLPLTMLTALERALISCEPHRSLTAFADFR